MTELFISVSLQETLLLFLTCRCMRHCIHLHNLSKYFIVWEYFNDFSFMLFLLYLSFILVLECYALSSYLIMTSTILTLYWDNHIFFSLLLSLHLAKSMLLVFCFVLFSHTTILLVPTVQIYGFTHLASSTKFPFTSISKIKKESCECFCVQFWTSWNCSQILCAVLCEITLRQTSCEHCGMERRHRKITSLDQ